MVSKEFVNGIYTQCLKIFYLKFRHHNVIISFTIYERKSILIFLPMAGVADLHKEKLKSL